MKAAPLSGGFMITSIVGFLASVFFIYKISIPWGFAFAVFFIIMFVASILSFVHYPLADESFKRKKVNKS